MHAKIEEYNHDIKENLRFLKGLDNDLPTGTKPKL